MSSGARYPHTQAAWVRITTSTFLLAYLGPIYGVQDRCL